MTTFCKDCGSILVPRRIDGKISLLCIKCGTSSTNKKNKDLMIKTKIQHNETSKTVVISSEDQKNSQGTVRVECQKCNNNEAITYYLQTRSGDEGSTQFYQCTKCGNKWRDYG